jgi:hypothetical protein
MVHALIYDLFNPDMFLKACSIITTPGLHMMKQVVIVEDHTARNAKPLSSNAAILSLELVV